MSRIDDLARRVDRTTARVNSVKRQDKSRSPRFGLLGFYAFLVAMFAVLAGLGYSPFAGASVLSIILWWPLTVIASAIAVSIVALFVVLGILAVLYAFGDK